VLRSRHELRLFFSLLEGDADLYCGCYGCVVFQFHFHGIFDFCYWVIEELQNALIGVAFDELGDDLAESIVIFSSMEAY